MLHSFSVTGTDKGPDGSGYVDNFAIGTLELTGGGSLSLEPAAANAALHVDAFILDGGISQLSSIVGNGVTLYYDPADPSMHIWAIIPTHSTGAGSHTRAGTLFAAVGRGSNAAAGAPSPFFGGFQRPNQ